MPVLEPADKAEFDKILADAGGKLVVIDFFATWCGPCKIMGPKFHKLSDEFTEVVCVKVDVDEQEAILAGYDIKVMPTFIFLKDGEQIHVIEGNNADELRKSIVERKWRPREFFQRPQINCKRDLIVRKAHFVSLERIYSNETVVMTHKTCT